MNAVRWALELGYRHIDTAQDYGNEESVGQALRSPRGGGRLVSGRADLFRGLPPNLLGTEFDIEFRVTDAVISAVVLESACYQSTVSQ